MLDTKNQHHKVNAPQEMFGFIFNLDGAVVDTAPHHVAAWQKVLAEKNTTKSTEEIRPKQYGTGSEIARRFLSEQLTSAQIEMVCQRQEQLFQENYRSQMQLISGLQKFLDDARAMNIPMALTCDSSLALTNFLIDGLGIKSYFKVVVGAEDVDRGRPNPDILLKASLRLGLMPEECVVFDSSPSGIEAAQRAGVRVLKMQLNPNQRKKNKLNLMQKIADYHALRPSLVYSHSQTI